MLGCQVMAFNARERPKFIRNLGNTVLLDVRWRPQRTPRQAFYVFSQHVEVLAGLGVFLRVFAVAVTLEEWCYQAFNIRLELVEEFFAFNAEYV